LDVAFGLVIFKGLPKPSCWSGSGSFIFCDRRAAKTEGIMDNRRVDNRLDGKWRVVRKFIADDTAGKSMTMYEDYFVEFVADDTLIETHGAETTTTSYRFDPDTRTIEIQPTTRSQPSPISGAGDTIFHIIP
jgi:hypothetical protein